jgi:hypothetical protein
MKTKMPMIMGTKVDGFLPVTMSFELVTRTEMHTPNISREAKSYNDATCCTHEEKPEGVVSVSCPDLDL